MEINCKTAESLTSHTWSNSQIKLGTTEKEGGKKKNKTQHQCFMNLHWRSGQFFPPLYLSVRQTTKWTCWQCVAQLISTAEEPGTCYGLSIKSISVLFYVCSHQGGITPKKTYTVHIKVALYWKREKEKIYKLTHRTMNNQFNNRMDNISIIQNMFHVVASIKVISIFLK